MDHPPVRDNWFQAVRRAFSAQVKPFAGKPITYVETGCWCGASAEWVCQNLLTHPDACGYGIDPWVSMGGKHDQKRMDEIAAYADFVLAFPHLKVGSLVIWDDYGIALRKPDHPIPDVAAAVESIMHSFKIFLEQTGQGKQFYARVVRKPELGRYIGPEEILQGARDAG